MSESPRDVETKTLAETNNFIAWEAKEPDGEITYHMELNSVTLHFFREEWHEFLELMQKLS